MPNQQILSTSGPVLMNNSLAQGSLDTIQSVESSEFMSEDNSINTGRFENSMDIKERKEFEKYLAENPEHKKKVDDVRNAMNIMKTAPSLKTSDSFDKKLQDRINALNDNQNVSSGNPIICTYKSFILIKPMSRPSSFLIFSSQ